MNHFPAPRSCFAALLCSLLMSTQVHASLVNVDFNAGQEVTYLGAAVVGSAGDTWNGIDGGTLGSPTTVSSVSLVDSAGTSTSLTLSVTGTQGAYDSTSAGCLMSSSSFASLMCDYIYRGQGATATVTLAGLTPGAAFDLILYSMANSPGRVTNFTLDGVTQVVTAADGSSFVLGVNYTEFTGIVDASGQLSLTFTGPDSEDFSEGNLDGFQLTQNLSRSVPEPGTFALAGLALVGIAASRRRKQ